MPGRYLAGRLGPSLLIFLSFSAALVSCAGHSSVKLPQTATSTASTFAAPTAAPDTTRISYPWPMKERQNPYTGQSEWLPDDTRVYEELGKDFLTYWVWSGQAGPASFPFAPDPQQIALLATPDFSQQLAAYSDQIRSSGQVTAYLPTSQAHDSSPLQMVQTCTQDGLQCQSYYSFSFTNKTVYNAQTGQIISQKPNVQIIFLVTQSYDKEMRRWQLSDLRFQELNV